MQQRVSRQTIILLITLCGFFSNSRSWFVNLLYDHSSGQWEGHAILSAVFGSNFCHFTSQVVLGKASPSRHGGGACPLWESIWGVGSQS